MKDSTLEKYKAVVDEWFLNGKNGIEATRKFYPKAAYSTLNTTWQKIAKNSQIISYTQSKENALSEASKISQELILKRLKSFLEADPLDYVKVQNNTIEDFLGNPMEVKTLTIKNLEEIPKSIRQTISSLEPSKEGIKIKFYDKLKTIEIINKMLGYNHESEKPKELFINYSEYSDEQLANRLNIIMKIKKQESKEG